jgi:hypothetical protein
LAFQIPRRSSTESFGAAARVMVLEHVPEHLLGGGGLEVGDCR